MSIHYCWLSSCMEDSSVHVTSLTLLMAWRIRVYTAMPTQSASMRGLAELLLPWKIHLSDVQQQTIVHREVLYPCSFSMACTCSWTATVSSSLRIFCSTNALIQSLFWRGSLSQVFWQCCQFPDTAIHSLYLEQLWHLPKVQLHVLTLSSMHNQRTKSIWYTRVYAECTPTARTWVNAYYISSTGTVRKLFIDRNCKCSLKQNFSNYHSTHIKRTGSVLGSAQLSCTYSVPYTVIVLQPFPPSSSTFVCPSNKLW